MASMGDHNWSVRRLASRCGLPETTVRRYVGELESGGVFLTGWPLDRAVVGIRAYRDGHRKEAIGVLGDQPWLGSQTWLVSGADPASDIRVFSTLLQATAFIEAHANTTYHLSPVGVMGLEAA